ncbi:MAG: cysteine--tRNA ligase, partial [Thaumarchaeota archaeon]|nr:cysteine--tRNA ligase [Nitrososphaerota archaeon]
MMVHDTLGGSRVAVGPSGTVRMYVCGVTAYDDAHVGHARSAVVFDVMRRHLERGGARVELVQNFTDVDDKILARAAGSGEAAAALAGRHMARYTEDTDSLNVLRPTVAPRASDHIGDMVDMIRELVASGAAYETPTGVYFDVS